MIFYLTVVSDYFGSVRVIFFAECKIGNVRYIGKPICCMFPMIHSEKN